jgi:hypothetical protein
MPRSGDLPVAQTVDLIEDENASEVLRQLEQGLAGCSRRRVRIRRQAGIDRKFIRLLFEHAVLQPQRRGPIRPPSD